MLYIEEVTDNSPDLVLSEPHIIEGIAGILGLRPKYVKAPHLKTIVNEAVGVCLFKRFEILYQMSYIILFYILRIG